MKDLIGRPGTMSGLALRIGQSAFAAASIGVMVSALGFSSFTAFWYFHFFPCSSFRITNLTQSFLDFVYCIESMIMLEEKALASP